MFAHVLNMPTAFQVIHRDIVAVKGQCGYLTMEDFRNEEE